MAKKITEKEEVEVNFDPYNFTDNTPTIVDEVEVDVNPYTMPVKKADREAKIKRENTLFNELNRDTGAVGNLLPEGEFAGINEEDINPIGGAEFLHESQTTGDLLKAAGLRAGAEVIGGTIEGIGYMPYWLPGVDAVKEGEKEYGNFVSRFGKSIREGATELAPIYNDPNETRAFRPWDGVWWAENAGSIASTLSLMIPSGLAVGLATKGAKALRLGAKAGKIASKSNKFLKVAESLGKTPEQLIGYAATGMGQAVISRQMENHMEAAGVFDRVYQETGDTNAAGEAASNSYKANWAMLAQDIPQYMLLRGMSIGKSARAAKAAGLAGEARSIRTSKIADFVGNSLGEGAEEAYQFIVGEEAARAGRIAAGMEDPKDSSFGERVAEYMSDGELWSSAFLGSIGGAVFQAAGPGITRATDKVFDRKTADDLAVEDVKSREAKKNAIQDLIQQAEESGNDQAVEEATFEMVAEDAVDAAKRGNTEYAKQQVINALNENEKGVSDERKEKLISLYDSAITSRNKHLGRGVSPMVVDEVVKNELRINEYNNQLKDTETKLSEVKDSLPLVGKLTPNGRVELGLNIQEKASDQRIKINKARLKDGNLKKPERDAITEEIKQIETIKNSIKEAREEIKKDDSRTDKEKQSDTEIIKTAAISDAVSLEIKKKLLEYRIKKISKLYNDISNPENQEDLEKEVISRANEHKTDSENRKKESLDNQREDVTNTNIFKQDAVKEDFEEDENGNLIKKPQPRGKNITKNALTNRYSERTELFNEEMGHIVTSHSRSMSKEAKDLFQKAIKDNDVDTILDVLHKEYSINPKFKKALDTYYENRQKVLKDKIENQPKTTPFEYIPLTEMTQDIEGEVVTKGQAMSEARNVGGALAPFDATMMQFKMTRSGNKTVFSKEEGKLVPNQIAGSLGMTEKDWEFLNSPDGLQVGDEVVLEVEKANTYYKSLKGNDFLEKFPIQVVHYRNGQRYVVGGFAAASRTFRTEEDKQRVLDIRKEITQQLNKAKEDETVQTTFKSKVKVKHAGRISNQTDFGNKDVVNKLNDVLTRTTPEGKTVKDDLILGIAVRVGGDIVLKVPNAGKATEKYNDSIQQGLVPGATYMLVPTSNGQLIPTRLLNQRAKTNPTIAGRALEDILLLESKEQASPGSWTETRNKINSDIVFDFNYVKGKKDNPNRLEVYQKDKKGINKIVFEYTKEGLVSRSGNVTIDELIGEALLQVDSRKINTLNSDNTSYNDLISDQKRVVTDLIPGQYTHSSRIEMEPIAENNKNRVKEVKNIKQDSKDSTQSEIEAKKAEIERRRQEELESGIEVYHGTSEVFDEFDFEKGGSGFGAQKFGKGIYVTKSKDKADSYRRKANNLKNKKEGGQVKELIVDIKNPIDAKSKKFEEFRQKYPNDAELTKALKEAGYDGVIYPQTKKGEDISSYVVFDKSQLKYKDKINAKYDAELKALEESTSQSTSKEIKSGVQELFEENPKLANSVYEALGFDINTLSYAERAKKYKEFGIKKSDGTEITEQDIEQNPTFYQNNTDQSTEKYIASEKTIRDLAARMSDRIGIPVRFESDRTKNYKGKLENGVAVINLAYATLDTPIHEILGHSIIRAIKGNILSEADWANTLLSGQLPFEENQDISPEAYKKYVEWKRNSNVLYQNLLKELETGKGKEVLDRIKRDYNKKEIQSNISNEDLKTITGEENLPKYTLEEQQEEAIVELLGLMTAEKLDNVKDGKLISLLKRLLKEMKAFMRSLIRQREVEIDKLPDNMTLGDIADLLAYSNSKLILPGNEVVYTTPDNQTFKTYQEASNHIGNLAKNVEDVNLDNISINDIKIDKNNLPSDFKNYYVSHKAEIAFMKDSSYNDEYNNKIQELRDKYTGKFIVVAKSEYGVYPNTTENQSFYDTKEEADNAALDRNIEQYKKEKGIKGFIEKNKEYEQSKEIIDVWKKVNNIQYNPEEIYSRGQEFSSIVGAYSNFDVDLMMQNLLSHIEDNEKAGGKFAISAYTKPVDKQIGHLEGDGGKIKFKIYPKSEDILWAANTDVYSGSVWDASKKVSKGKKSELLGVSYTKYPSLQNVNTVQPNLADIVDNLAHHHNELGITLTGNNFRLEYDEDIPYSTKKIINGINSILDQKYGKLVKPEIKKVVNNRQELENRLWNLREQEQELFATTDYESIDLETADKISKEIDNIESKLRVLTTNIGKQPTQTNETLKESIESVKNKIDNPNLQKEYTSQALINTKIAKLKEVAKKYPRNLIRSEVKPYKSTDQKQELFDVDELPFQLVGNNNLTPKQQLEERLKKLEAQAKFQEYVNTTGKQDIEGFKEFVDKEVKTTRQKGKASTVITEYEYKGIKVFEVENKSSDRGATYKNDVIYINRPTLQKIFDDKRWAKPKTITEKIDGKTIEADTTPLPEDTFKTFQELINFTLEHEYQHSKLSYEEFLEQVPWASVKADYEDHINKLAFEGLKKDNLVNPSKKVEKDTKTPKSVIQSSDVSKPEEKPTNVKKENTALVKPSDADTKEKQQPESVNSEVFEDKPIIKRLDLGNMPKIKEGKGKPGEKFSAKDGREYDSFESKTEEIEWFKKNFPNVPITVLDNLIEINKKGGAYAWGVFRNAAVEIFKEAPVGTTYHEAFHVVFGLFLNDSQKEQILNEFRKDKNIDNDTAEEKLADKFAEYMITEMEDKSLGSRINIFFKKLWQTIKSMFTNRVSINDLFFRTQVGFYGKNPFTKDVSRFEDTVKYKVKGLTYKQQEEALKTINGLFTQRINEAQEEEQYKEFVDRSDVIVAEGIDRISGSIYNALLDRAEEFIQEGENERAATLNTIASNFIVGIDNKNNLIYGKLAELAYRNIRDREGIKIAMNKKNRVVSKANVYNPDAILEDIGETETKLEGWQTSVENTSGKVGLSKEIRKELSHLSVGVNDFGFVEYANFHTTYAYLKRELSDIYSPSVMLDKLQELVKYKPYLQQLVDKLNEGTKESNILRSKFIVDFTKSSLTEKLIIETDKGFQLIDANRYNINNLIINEWKNNLTDKSTYIVDKDGNIDTSKVADVIAEYDSFIETIKEKTELKEKDISAVEEILKKIGVEIKAAELIKSYTNKDGTTQTNSLKKVLYTHRNSFKTLISTFKDGKSPYEEGNKENSLVKALAKEVATSRDDLFESSYMTIDNKTRYAHVVPNYLSMIISDLTGPNYKDAINYFTETPFYANNAWLKRLENNEELRKNFKTIQLGGIRYKNERKGAKYEDMGDAKLAASEIIMYFNNGSENYAYYKVPVHADAPTANFIRAEKFNNIDDVITHLYSVALQEDARIKQIKDRKDGDNPSIKNFDSKESENFLFLPFLNEYKGDIQENPDAVKEFIKEHLDSRLEVFKDNLLKKGVIVPNEEGNGYVTDMIPEGTLKEGELRRMFFNRYLANKQIIMLTSGDLAFYKPDSKGVASRSIDFYKRNKQTYSPKQLLDLSAINANYLTFYKADVEVTRQGLIDKIASVQGNSEIANKYKDSNETDAQAYITIKRYKEIMTGLGRWNDTLEQLYEPLRTARTMKELKQMVEEEGLDIEDVYETIMQPLKPFYFGTIKQGDLVVPVQNKNSELLLVPSFTEGTELQDYLDNIQEVEDESGLAASLQFESAVKVGLMNVITEPSQILEKEGNVYKNAITLNNKDFGIQGETPEHHVDAKNLDGTQKRKLTLADIELNGKYRNGMTGQEIKEEVENLLYDMVSTSYNDAVEATGSIEKIKETLLEQIIERGLSENYEEAIEIVERSYGKDFALPLYFPLHSKRNEQLLFSVFKSRVSKQKVNGGTFIQASSFGFTNELEIKINEKEKRVEYVEAKLPYWSAKYFKGLVKEDGTIDMDKIDPDVLKMIGYRIPTEGKYSIMPLKVVGFTHPSLGGIIQLPAEITTISGSDFDIDKMFVAIPNTEVESDNGTEIKRLKAIKYDKDYINSKDANKSKVRKMRENRLLEIQYDIMTDPYTFDDFINPGNFDILKNNIVPEILALEGKINETLDPGDFTDDLEIYNRNMAGKQLIGIFANQNTSHALTSTVRNPISFTESVDLFGYNLRTISMMRTIDQSEKISKNLATLLAAVVDNAKEPVASFLNMNTYTADSISYLLRTGLPMRETFLFMSQPILKELSQTYYDKGAGFKADLEAIDAIRSKSLFIKADSEISDINAAIASKKLELSQTKDIKIYEDNIKNPDPITQLAILEIFVELKEQAKNLSIIVSGTQSDTSYAGPTASHNEVFERKVKKVEELMKSGIAGLEQVFNEKGIVNTFYEFGIKLPDDHMKEYFIWNNKELRAIKDTIQEYVPNRDLTAEELEHINYSLLSYYASGFEYFDQSQASDIINNVPSELKSMQKLYPENALLKRLVLNNQDGVDYIEFNNTGAFTDAEKDTVSNAWSDLLEKEDTKEFADRLIKYTYFTNGFNFTPSSFTHVLPTTYFTDMMLPDNSGRTFIEYLNSVKEGTRLAVDRIITNRFIDQYFKNNAHKSSLVPVVTKEDRGVEIKEDLVKLNGHSSNLITTDKLGVPSSYPYAVTTEGKTKKQNKTYYYYNTKDNYVIYTTDNRYGVPNRVQQYDINNDIITPFSKENSVYLQKTMKEVKDVNTTNSTQDKIENLFMQLNDINDTDRYRKMSKQEIEDNKNKCGL